MSKLIDATIKCPKCGKEYPVKLFRTIWGEHETNRNLVMNDEINVCTCNSCGFSFKASYPFMYVDVKEGFAVWWEPFHDNGIDADTAGYDKNVWSRKLLCNSTSDCKLGDFQGNYSEIL